MIRDKALDKLKEAEMQKRNLNLVLKANIPSENDVAAKVGELILGLEQARGDAYRWIIEEIDNLINKED